MGKLLTPEVAGVAEEESGLAADLNNTSVQIGTALGVAILSTVAASQAAGASPVAGFQSGFAATVVSPTLGVLVALLLLGRRPRKSAMATTTPAIESAGYPTHNRTGETQCSSRTRTQ